MIQLVDQHFLVAVDDAPCDINYLSKLPHKIPTKPLHNYYDNEFRFSVTLFFFYRIL